MRDCICFQRHLRNSMADTRCQGKHVHAYDKTLAHCLHERLCMRSSRPFTKGSKLETKVICRQGNGMFATHTHKRKRIHPCMTTSWSIRRGISWDENQEDSKSMPLVRLPANSATPTTLPFIESQHTTSQNVRALRQPP